MLVRHGSTTATRAGAFPVDELLDDAGFEGARALAGVLSGRRTEILASPARRCRQTAAAAGVAEPRIDPALAECDFGTWGGRSLAELHAEDEAAVGTWMTDAHAAPHGGESLADFAGRVGTWLDAQAEQDGAAVAVTHGGVVKAAVAHALGAPLAAFWRIDVSPLALTELHAHDGRWTVVRTNCVAGATYGAATGAGAATAVAAGRGTAAVTVAEAETGGVA